MTGAEIVVESLRKEKVDTIFCYTGGAVIPVFDELYRKGKDINKVIPRHEQGGAHAADGYARSTGKPGVLLVTSGPGAANAICGIATAYMDSTPMVVLSGQVPQSKIGTDAFQEADITGMTISVTKAGFLVTDIKDLAGTISKAFYLAVSGRPGPVLIDIPSNLFKEEADFVYEATVKLESYKLMLEGHSGQIKNCLELVKKSKRPVVLVGGGGAQPKTMDKINQFIDKWQIPVAHTLMGHGCAPKNESLYLGTTGMHGSVCGNYALKNCDLLIAIGARFSDRTVGVQKLFAEKAKIVHIDVDPAEIGKTIKADVPIVGTSFNIITELLKFDAAPAFSEWIDELGKVGAENPVFTARKSKKVIVGQFIRELANRLPDDTIVVSDVGQNQMWVAQYYRFRQTRLHLTSGGMGTMGFSLPAAIGAKIGNPDRFVLSVSGDGGFQMNLQELGTIKNQKIDVKMVVLDNGSLGMVRQWQELFYDGRLAGTQLSDNPDFVKLAAAYDIPGSKIAASAEIGGAIDAMIASSSGYLLHVVLEENQMVYPMIPTGKTLDDVIVEDKRGAQ